MTEKAAFNAEEWEKLLEAPALVALRMVVADRGGTIRESLSLGRAYAEARGGAADGLLKEIVSSAPHVDPQGLKDPGALEGRANASLGEAIDLLEQKATPDEVEAYRDFVLKVADTVARAHKEGGVLGIGGKEISESEQAVLDDLSATLGRSSPGS
jgi:hypothetical protein